MGGCLPALLFRAVTSLREERYYLSLIYKNAVALVMPSFFGPTNIPQLEAFGLGCPVLASNVYAVPQQVQGAALLFDPHEEGDMASKIELVWTDDDLRQELIQKDLQRAREWNQEKFSHELLAIVKHCISSDP